MTKDNNDNDSSNQDWNMLAMQALDLWQSNLTSLSKDEKAKDEMANIMRPMAQMATQWTDMMQNMGVFPGQDEVKEKEEQTESKDTSKNENECSDTSLKQDNAKEAVKDIKNNDIKSDETTNQQSKEHGNITAGASSSRDLADIASRLANLEQELDGLRVKSKSSNEDNKSSATGS